MTDHSHIVQPDAKYTTGPLVKRIMKQYMAQHWGKYLIASIFMLGVAGSAAGQALLLGPVIDEVFINKNGEMLWLVSGAAFALSVMNGGCVYGQAVLMNRAGQTIVATVQRQMYAHLVKSDLTFFHHEHTGRLVSRFIFDAEMLYEAVSKALTGMFKDGIMAIAFIGVMFYRDWQLTVAALVVLPIVMAPMALVHRKLRKAAKRTQESTGDLSVRLEESFKGIRHIKAYVQEDFEIDRSDKSIAARLKPIFKAAQLRAATSPVSETMAGVAVAITILYGGMRVIDGAMTPGSFVSFIAALLMAYRPLKSLANLSTALQEGMSAAERIFGLMDQPPHIVDRKDAPALTVTKGHVRLQDVSFAYDAEHPVLSDIRLDAQPGQKVALVGPSGAGKSTIINLLPRFYDVTAGAVQIDGQDVREVTLGSLRKSMALVSQETFLFDDTIAANIAYGKTGATQDQIEAAAKTAAAHDFIVGLPDGYETSVGESGLRLSGGQRQRIAIARALLKDAPILLLDEATSALDNESEHKVQAALDELSQGRTSIVVAHRLSTVMDADQIIVMERGGVVAQGTHDSLLAQGGVYARLWQLQHDRNLSFDDAVEAAFSGSKAEKVGA